jgi:hypothetical protein
LFFLPEGFLSSKDCGIIIHQRRIDNRRWENTFETANRAMKLEDSELKKSPRNPINAVEGIQGG